MQALTIRSDPKEELHAPTTSNVRVATEELAAGLKSLGSDLEALREGIKAGEGELVHLLEGVHPDHVPSARNLIHYMALRRHDVRELQERLANAGLSSLGRSEPHVLATLDRVISLVAKARGSTAVPHEDEPVGFREGEGILRDNAERLLGPTPARRPVRIVVTLPSRAANDLELVTELLTSGMDCARINCGRGDAAEWTAMARNVREAEETTGNKCRILCDLAGPKVRTTRIDGGRKSIRLFAGNRFELVRSDSSEPQQKSRYKRVGCSAAELFDDAKPGEAIWFDDGKIGGTIEKRTPGGFLIQVTHAEPGGTKLRGERGINVPETTLKMPALGEGDREDLACVAEFADIIGMSFVQQEQDVLALHDALKENDASHLGIILKIEKKQAFSQLPRLMLAAMRARDCGVMIARGDLAVEVGFERMAEVQEEILWIAEAAHMPTVWATQVLESLAKNGSPSRAEVTDAAMSARAEAVMLNKGRFIVEAIRTLDNILSTMQEHQSKKRSLFRALNVSESLWSSNQQGTMPAESPPET